MKVQSVKVLLRGFLTPEVDCSLGSSNGDLISYWRRLHKSTAVSGLVIWGGVRKQNPLLRKIKN